MKVGDIIIVNETIEQYKNIVVCGNIEARGFSGRFSLPYLEKCGNIKMSHEIIDAPMLKECGSISNVLGCTLNAPMLEECGDIKMTGDLFKTTAHYINDHSTLNAPILKKCRSIDINSELLNLPMLEECGDIKIDKSTLNIPILEKCGNINITSDAILSALMLVECKDIYMLGVRMLNIPILEKCGKVETHHSKFNGISLRECGELNAENGSHINIPILEKCIRIYLYNGTVEAPMLKECENMVINSGCEVDAPILEKCIGVNASHTLFNTPLLGSHVSIKVRLNEFNHKYYVPMGKFNAPMLVECGHVSIYESDGLSKEKFKNMVFETHEEMSEEFFKEFLKDIDLESLKDFKDF